MAPDGDGLSDVETDVVKEFFETILRLLPQPMRTSVLIGVGFLAVQIFLTKTMQQSEFRDVFVGRTFLLVFSSVLAFWAVQSFRTWVGVGRLVVTLILVACALIVGRLTWEAWPYAYNPIGIYEQRRWNKVSEVGTKYIFKWKIFAIRESPVGFILHITTTDQCGVARIENVRPQPGGSVLPAGYESGIQSPSSREWTFTEFQRPEDLTFFLTLTLSGDYNAPQNCFAWQLSPLRATGSEDK